MILLAAKPVHEQQRVPGAPGEVDDPVMGRLHASFGEAGRAALHAQGEEEGELGEPPRRPKQRQPGE